MWSRNDTTQWHNVTHTSTPVPDIEFTQQATKQGVRFICFETPPSRVMIQSFGLVTFQSIAQEGIFFLWWSSWQDFYDLLCVVFSNKCWQNYWVRPLKIQVGVYVLIDCVYNVVNLIWYYSYSRLQTGVLSPSQVSKRVSESRANVSTTWCIRVDSRSR
jgi:hypothetical protein